MEHKLTFQQYNEALKKNKLLGLKCLDCGAITVPPKMVCCRCASPNLEVIQLNGDGKVRTFTVVNVAAEGREAECPYVIVMVEMEEGPWVTGNLIGLPPVEVGFERVMNRPVKMVRGEVFPGDRYSAGETARPLFSLVL